MAEGRMRMAKKGAFLTLGMTLISLLILALGAMILKNAISSEERVMEVGSLDRLHDLAVSLDHAYREILFSSYDISMGYESTDDEKFLVVKKALRWNGESNVPFMFFNDSYLLFSSYVKSLYPSWTSAQASIFAGVNGTGVIADGFNVSVVMARVPSTVGSVHFPSTLPGNSEALLVYADESNVVESYYILFENPLLRGNVLWELLTPGSDAVMNVTFVGANGVSSRQENVGFGTAGLVAQNVTINITGGSINQPLVSAGRALTGPFAGRRQVLIGSYGFNMTVTAKLEYKGGTLRENVTRLYSYDVLNISIPGMRVGKVGGYRVV